jgi:hypothetical protein
MLKLALILLVIVGVSGGVAAFAATGPSHANAGDPARMVLLLGDLHARGFATEVSHYWTQDQIDKAMAYDEFQWVLPLDGIVRAYEATYSRESPDPHLSGSHRLIWVDSVATIYDATSHAHKTWAKWRARLKPEPWRGDRWFKLVRPLGDEWAFRLDVWDRLDAWRNIVWRSGKVIGLLTVRIASESPPDGVDAHFLDPAFAIQLARSQQRRIITPGVAAPQLPWDAERYSHYPDNDLSDF